MTERRRHRRRRSARDVGRAARAAPAAAGSRRRAAATPAQRRPGTLREFKESAERAFLVEQAARERLEHLEDRRSDRHAAQQPLQEARAVPDHAGDGRVATVQRRLPSLQRSRDGRSLRYQYDRTSQSSQTIAWPGREGRAGGKSELRRAVRRVTPGQGNLKESGTENIPPVARAPSKRRSEGKGEKVR